MSTLMMGHAYIKIQGSTVAKLIKRLLHGFQSRSPCMCSLHILAVTKWFYPKTSSFLLKMCILRIISHCKLSPSGGEWYNWGAVDENVRRTHQDQCKRLAGRSSTLVGRWTCFQAVSLHDYEKYSYQNEFVIKQIN